MLFAAVDRVREVDVRVGTAGEWTLLNPAWSDQTGFPVEVSLSRGSADFVHVDERTRHVEELAALVDATKSFTQYEARFLTAVGDVRWMEVQALPMVGADGTSIAPPARSTI